MKNTSGLVEESTSQTEQSPTLKQTFTIRLVKIIKKIENFFLPINLYFVCALIACKGQKTA